MDWGKIGIDLISGIAKGIGDAVSMIVEAAVDAAKAAFNAAKQWLGISSPSKKGMFIGGTIFGCCSFFLAVIIANPVFINPLISILPRVFIGVIAYLVYALVSKITKNSTNGFVKEVLPSSIAGAFGILTNTVCTIFMLWVFDKSGLSAVFTTIMSVNFLGEIIGAIVLVPIYLKILKRMKTKL